MLRDHQLFVRWDHKDGNPAFRPRNEGFARRIRRWIKNDAKPSELLRDAGADGWRVLANASREHERIEPAQGRRQHSGIEAYAVNEVVDGEYSAGIGTRLEISHVIADAGEYSGK